MWAWASNGQLHANDHIKRCLSILESVTGIFNDCLRFVLFPSHLILYRRYYIVCVWTDPSSYMPWIPLPSPPHYFNSLRCADLAKDITSWAFFQRQWHQQLKPGRQSPDQMILINIKRVLAIALPRKPSRELYHMPKIHHRNASMTCTQR